KLKLIKYTMDDLKNVFSKNNLNDAVKKIEKYCGTKEQTPSASTTSTSTPSTTTPKITVTTNDKDKLRIPRLSCIHEQYFGDDMADDIATQLQNNSRLTTHNSQQLWYAIASSFLGRKFSQIDFTRNGAF